MRNTLGALRSNAAAVRRAEAYRARTDTRSWVVERRERTHRLIELGGLVQKSGLADAVDDDRATLYGALLALAETLSPADRQATLALWRRRGQRAFEAEQDAKKAAADAPAVSP
ncbi:MAG: conjugal transfer protein TraD [Phenylobacterium sp.]|nr:conjugal transfer protein TraD [Phenylobacterium sp.]